MSQADTITPEMRQVDGRVQLGRRSGPKPVAGTWVVVHRIGQDRSGPLDSARTSRSGAYSIRYRVSGDASALYIAVASYAGIAYITSPLRLQRVTGDDGQIMVYDTTTPPYPIRVAGRHFVITNPGEDGTRRVIEVYELMNDSTLTVVGTEAKPVWRTPLPSGLSNFQLNPAGDITPGTVRQVGERLDVLAPISPGMRQLSFSYTLGPSAFPLALPVVDSVQVFEVLVQELGATVDGAGLAEVAPVAQQGQTFRRLIAEDVKRNAVVTLTMPTMVGNLAKRGVSIVGTVIGIAMVLSLVFIVGRRRRVTATAIAVFDAATGAAVDPAASAAVNLIETMIRDIATLDADFERRAAPTDAERAAFTSERSALKSKLTAALAAREGRT